MLPIRINIYSYILASTSSIIYMLVCDVVCTVLKAWDLFYDVARVRRAVLQRAPASEGQPEGPEQPARPRGVRDVLSLRR